LGKQTSPKAELLEFVPRPSRPPVVVTYGFTGWLKKHLFGGVWNTLLTIAVFSLLYMLLKPFLEWSVIKAVWVASTRRECLEISPDGACWAGVIRWFNNLIYGRYPNDLQWRINLGFGIGLVWLMPLVLKKLKNKIAIGIMAVVLYPFLANYLFLGGDRSYLHYIIACVALAYLLMMYINIILIYTGYQQLGQYLEPLLERVSQKKAALLSHLACLLVLSFLVGFIFQGVRLKHVGRSVSNHHHFQFCNCYGSADRYSSRLGPAFKDAGYEVVFNCHNRIGAISSNDHCFVHVCDNDAVVLSQYN
jgi:general L-amino acid transport system permease protein